jgi:hypothetical protein
MAGFLGKIPLGFDLSSLSDLRTIEPTRFPTRGGRELRKKKPAARTAAGLFRFRFERRIDPPA